MGKDPGRIRAEIEETRAQLDDRPVDQMREEIQETRSQIGETVGALGEKANVKARVKDSVASKKDSVVGAVSSGKNAVVGKADALVTSVTGGVPDSDQVKHGARKVGIARENPAGLAIGGAAVGFLVGLLIPSTQIEDEKLGDMADDVKGTVKETGQEALERGKQVDHRVSDADRQPAARRVGRIDGGSADGGADGRHEFGVQLGIDARHPGFL